MKLKIKNKPAYKIESIVFKETGLKITQEDGTTDLYKYDWLSNNEAEIVE